MLAEDDFPRHAFARFPAISKQTKQVQHLTHEQCDQLLRAVEELSPDSARQLLDPDEYVEFKRSKNNQVDQSNYIGLYEALVLGWFYTCEQKTRTESRGSDSGTRSTRLLSAIWRQ